MWKWLAILALSSAPAGTQFGLTVGAGADSGPPIQPRPRPAPTSDGQAECASNRPPPDRSCVEDSDCVVVWRNVSCCGTQTVNGISRSGLARFQEQERGCSTGRRCGCAPGPTRLDDGSRLERNGKVLVACRQRLCTTYLASQSVQSLPRCPPAQCGPSPAYPNWSCPDGVSVGGLGPCVRIDGRCRWAHLECP